MNYVVLVVIVAVVGYLVWSRKNPEVTTGIAGAIATAAALGWDKIVAMIG